MTRTFAFPGHLTMAELQTQIQGAEINDLKLVDCVVFADKQNKLRVACDFEESGLPIGELLDPIILLPNGSIKPTGSGVFLFSHIVVCENKLIAVDFYR
jgi:hypothetical protein